MKDKTTVYLTRFNMNRLTKIYTKQGDQGKTKLADGSSVSKHDAHIVALGEIDELNASLGVLRSQLNGKIWQQKIEHLQQQLFDFGAELVLPEQARIQETQIQQLEEQIDTLTQALGPLKDFILPGGSVAAAQAQLTRAVCRRAERSISLLHEEKSLSPLLLQYLNRLSDLLFMYARKLNKELGVAETLWDSSARE